MIWYLIIYKTSFFFISERIDKTLKFLNYCDSRGHCYYGNISTSPKMTHGVTTAPLVDIWRKYNSRIWVFLMWIEWNRRQSLLDSKWTLLIHTCYLGCTTEDNQTIIRQEVQNSANEPTRHWKTASLYFTWARCFYHRHLRYSRQRISSQGAKDEKTNQDD